MLLLWLFPPGSRGTLGLVCPLSHALVEQAWKEVHRDAPSNEVKGEYEYISMFVLGLSGGHRLLRLCTCAHTGQDSCLLSRIQHAHREWQETEEESRCESGDGWAHQQDDNEREELAALNGDARALPSHWHGAFLIVSSASLMIHDRCPVPPERGTAVTLLFHIPTKGKESREASRLPEIFATYLISAN